MATLKTNWMIASITSIILLFGAFLLINAAENKKDEAITVQTPLRWFQITGSHSPGSPIPQSDAVYLGTSVNPPEDMNECDGETNQCISGFNPSQTNPSGGSFVLDGTQAPVTTSALKD
ncbi:hypothetical protein [Sphingobacterium haloxyli]|uniref:Uncharacterized protein n=1 Tax=Sphingobacterium haloxyli TaxID=2100533 RepID=A0A2S9IYC2_9SPHI|nr:hypothetical protein [Sphingobacterium haloxyli]PRD45534.1 hypothetical protein C5745_17630 [Sphingobacterium haloxyli]